MGARNGVAGQACDHLQSRHLRGQGNRVSNGNGGRRINSRPPRKNNNKPPGNNGNDKLQHQNIRVVQVKPELWAAVESNDPASVQKLIMLGHNLEEKYQGWSPCMKAAEGNCTEVMLILLYKKADVEVCNRNGRTALSFAAAPSMDGSERRETAVDVHAG